MLLPSQQMSARPPRPSDAEVTSIVLARDVLYDPGDAWLPERNATCSTAELYTAQINASASFAFTGNRMQISGMGAGFFLVLVDNKWSFELLSPSPTSCARLMDAYFMNGTHNATIVLSKEFDNFPVVYPPSLHVTKILYWVPKEHQGPVPNTTAVGRLPSAFPLVEFWYGRVEVLIAVGCVLVLYLLALRLLRHMTWSHDSTSRQCSLDPSEVNTIKKPSPGNAVSRLDTELTKAGVPVRPSLDPKLETLLLSGI